MSTARDQILRLIRQANASVARSHNDQQVSIVRDYVHVGKLDEDGRLAVFMDRLCDYGTEVHGCRQDQVASTVSDCLRFHSRRKLVIPSDLPEHWRPEHFEFILDRELSYNQIDHADGAITTCTVAIASTGTIVLTHGPGEGRRALSLLPDYHLCIVRQDQICETLPEALSLLAHLSVRAVTFISGPSATSDIEMTRIKGIHGPRTLDVIVIRG